MKRFIKILEKPKIVVPSFIIIAIIVGVLSYKYIGQSPSVDISPDLGPRTIPTSSAGDIIDLSFSKTGRLAELSVRVGSEVKRGDVIASLDAGDSLGAVNQAKGALELAKAQYASIDVQYLNTKRSQDVLVNNARRTLLSSGLAATAQNKYSGSAMTVDNNQAPQISGSYTCDKEGSYILETYASGADSGYSFSYSGLEGGVGSLGNVTYYTPQPLGSCGLYIQFPVGYRESNNIRWVIDIPNTRSSSYIANRNAYDLVVATRDQTLRQLEVSLGKDESSGVSATQAAIDSAQGAYEVALANYRNNLIISPVDGLVTFVDSHLKIGQSVVANKTVITISQK